MPATIVPTRLPLDPSQRGNLQNLFGSPGYSLLKEVLVAHCINEQVQAVNAGLYSSNNDFAKETAERHTTRAAFINSMLDAIEDLEAKEDEWFTMNLECRR